MVRPCCIPNSPNGSSPDILHQCKGTLRMTPGVLEWTLREYPYRYELGYTQCPRANHSVAKNPYAPLRGISDTWRTGTDYPLTHTAPSKDWAGDDETRHPPGGRNMRNCKTNQALKPATHRQRPTTTPRTHAPLQRFRRGDRMTNYTSSFI